MSRPLSWTLCITFRLTLQLFEGEIATQLAAYQLMQASAKAIHARVDSSVDMPVCTLTRTPRLSQQPREHVGDGNFSTHEDFPHAPLNGL